MSTTEETNNIDEKKDSSPTSPDFKEFAKNYIFSIVFTIGIGVFIIGTIGLYTTKIAQANILPDNNELAPYTLFDRIVTDIPIDINVMRPHFFSENKDTLSQKAIFNSQEYLDSFKYSFLSSLKKSATTNSGMFANLSLFFSQVYDNIIAKNFLAINSVFLYLSYLPESLIMLLYGFLGIFLWVPLYLFNVAISIFYHIINIPQLFRQESTNDTNKWESSKEISFLRIIKLIVLFFLWIPIGLISISILPIFFTMYGLIAPLYATYKIKNDKLSQKKNIMDFIKDTFDYKKLMFFILATVSLFSNGTKYLGNNSIVAIAIAVMFAYFMGLYTNEMPVNGVNGFTSKIKETVKQSHVAEMDPTKLVEIWKPIPMDDKKVERLIESNNFRPLNTPKEVGGSVVSSLPPQITPEIPLTTPAPIPRPFITPVTPVVPVPTPVTPVTPVPTPVTPVAPPVTPVVTPVAPTPVAPVPPTPVAPVPTAQYGGTKRKSTKYNIRWT